MTRGAAVLLAAMALAGCDGMNLPDFPAPAPAAQPADHVALGKRLLAQNRPDLALAAFNRGIAGDDGPEAMTGAAISLLKLGRPAEARRLLEAALAREPDLPAARNALGVAYYEDGRHAAALQEFRRANELTGGADPSIAMNIGMAKMALAREEAGREASLDAVDYDVIQYGNGVFRLEPRAPIPPGEENRE